MSDGVPRRSLIVAAVIGTLLNLINQGDVLLVMGPVNWLKIGLTYVVPYCVSTYGAVSYRLSIEAAGMPDPAAGAARGDPRSAANGAAANESGHEQGRTRQP